MRKGKETPNRSAAPCRPKVRGRTTAWVAAAVAISFVAGWGASSWRAHQDELALGTPVPYSQRVGTRIGLSAELEAWLAKPDVELENADPLELNLLVAKGLPECSSIDIAACKRQVDGWADEIRAELAANPHGFENDRGKWGTRRRFELAVMGSVLMEDRRIGYVDRVSHSNAGHKFAHGVLQSGAGTCATLPVIWAALGRRLGHPISIAQVPEHLYCIVDDGQEKINLETTGSAHLSMNSDERMRRMCPPELVANGTFMRPFSNRELIGIFVGLRAEVWEAKGDFEKALSDYQRAHEIVPGNAVIAGNLMRAAGAVAQAINGRPSPAIAAAPEIGPIPMVRQALDVDAFNRETQARSGMPSGFPPASPNGPNVSSPNLGGMIR